MSAIYGDFIELQCDDLTCSATFPGYFSAAARQAATEAGWQCNEDADEDFCPEHKDGAK